MIDNIEVLTHSSIRITDGKCILYIDPFDIKNEPKDADYIFVTHDHYDHFSPKDIEKISCERTVLIVPEKMERKLRKFLPSFRKYIPLSPVHIMKAEISNLRPYPHTIYLNLFISREWNGSDTFFM